MRILLILLLGLLFLFNENILSQINTQCAQGRISIEVPDGYFDFPLEIYGAYVSFKNENVKIQIDSVLFLELKPNSRLIRQEKVLNMNELKKTFPNILRKMNLNFSSKILKLFKKYEVYLIKRTAPTFSPQDTIPHHVKRRDGKKVLVKDSNMNRYLIIKFDKQLDEKKVAEDFRKLKDIMYAQPEYPIITHEAPNDLSYQNGYQFYMDETIMNFEWAWDIVKGENGFDPITIAYIDHDFTNCNTHNDLGGNLNTTGPGNYTGQGTQGHGTEVASVANAITDNDTLIAGATWNCQFMPFVAYYPQDVVAALQTVRNYLDDSNLDNDCYVVNMSFGATDSPDLETICNDLNNNYWVLLVAAVADNGSSQISYPADYSSVIGVGASNSSDDGLYSSSNWGNDVELVATGESIYTLDYDNYNNHTPNWGTSYAAPFVSSTCALILSTEDGYIKSPTDIRSALQTTAHTINDYATSYNRVDVYEGLKEIFDIKITEDILFYTNWGIDDYVVFENPSPPSPVNIYVDGTTLDIIEGAVVVVESGVRVSAINGGYIYIDPNAKIILESEAEIIAGSEGIVFDNGGEVHFNGAGSCLSTTGGILKFASGINRVINNNGVIASFGPGGTIQIEDSARLTFYKKSELKLEAGNTVKLGSDWG